MEHAGNFNYGAMGKAAGLSEQELKRFAGVYQKYGNNGNTYKPEFRDPEDIDFPLFSPGTSYGDDPVDQRHIQDGMDWYDENYV